VAEAHCDGFLAYGTTLRWNRVRSASRYVVLRQTEGTDGFRRVAIVSGNDTTYADANLADSTTYRYAVRALRGGVRSAPSVPAEVTTKTFCFA
jgi:hypothetical protein